MAITDRFIDRRKFANHYDYLHRYVMGLSEDECWRYQETVRPFLVGESARCSSAGGFAETLVDIVVANFWEESVAV